MPAACSQLARHVESWLGMLMEPRQIPAFLEHCVVELDAPFDAAALALADGANADAASLPRPWLVARNLLFAEVATSWLGWAGLRPFFHRLLRPDRFRNLPRIAPEMSGTPTGG